MKPVVLSADGIAIRVGMNIIALETNDGGKTWLLKPDKVVEIREDGHFRTSLSDRGMYSTGSNRIYVNPAKAMKDAREHTTLPVTCPTCGHHG